MPCQQMSHQLINFPVLAPRQLGVFGKRKIFRSSYFPRLLKRGNNFFPKLFEERASQPCGHSAQILQPDTYAAMVRPYREKRRICCKTAQLSSEDCAKSNHEAFEIQLRN